MKLAASSLAGVLMLTLLYAQTPGSDSELDLTGHWTWSTVPNIIGTSVGRELFIENHTNGRNEYYLTIGDHSTGTVGVNEKSSHIFQWSNTKTGPYILLRDGDRFVYRDEKKQTSYLKIIVEGARTNLTDDKHKYSRSGP